MVEEHVCFAGIDFAYDAKTPRHLMVLNDLPQDIYVGGQTVALMSLQKRIQIVVTVSIDKLETRRCRGVAFHRTMDQGQWTTPPLNDDTRVPVVRRR